VEGPEEKPPTVWRQLATPFGDRIVNRNQSIYVATRCQAVEGLEEDPNRLATVGYALRPTRRESQPIDLCSHLLPSGGRSRGKTPNRLATVGYTLEPSPVRTTSVAASRFFLCVFRSSRKPIWGRGQAGFCRNPGA